ncbi:NAD-dependent epimerase/dehydratase family protein [Eubacterium ventriosum]|uniref:NAD-dependent epimerase/dehydratase family protein n=1 Tax=Eubacterium ventriosum TaxID=39496 RepID=A0A415LEV5_9FIRM|nr:NAD-dependent epimerase/dehydratase family protein [Eubacterium ventriosum]RHL47088.1 NAD-dependent epimerase/dehydratase family protein [Eubacterium ventriosum]
MSKIFISGAAGFIGSQLSYYLFKKGYHVTLLDNFSYGVEDNLIFPDCDFRGKIIRGDIRDKNLIDELFKKNKFDYVYHIAAITPLPDCQINPIEAVDVNITGTLTILEASRTYGVKKLVFASTSAVYENNEKFPLFEENPVRPNLIYPSTKYAAEQFCYDYVKNYDMNITCLRFANVYGPHIDCLRKQPPVVGYIIRELFYDRSPILHSTGNQSRDFVYVEDLISLCEMVLNGKGFDIVNVSSGISVSINELMLMISKLMNREEINAIYKGEAFFWKKYPELYKKPYPIKNEVLVHEVKKYTNLSNKHAFERYGWKPQTSMEEGLKRTISFVCEMLEKHC